MKRKLKITIKDDHNHHDVSGINSTLHSKCCGEEPHFRKKEHVEYYECPYCKQECEVEWMEDEFPDYCY